MLFICVLLCKFIWKGPLISTPCTLQHQTSCNTNRPTTPRAINTVRPLTPWTLQYHVPCNTMYPVTSSVLQHHGPYNTKRPVTQCALQHYASCNTTCLQHRTHRNTVHPATLCALSLTWHFVTPHVGQLCTLLHCTLLTQHALQHHATSLNMA